MAFLARRVIALLWTAAILGMTLLPSVGGPSMFEHQDKVAHFGAFAGFGLAWTWARVDARLVAGAGLVLAIVTEYGQGLLPWPRSPELGDLVADLVGLAVGQGLGWWLFGRRGRAGGAGPRHD